MRHGTLTTRVAAVAALSVISLAPGASAQTFDVKPVEVEKGAVDYGPETMFAVHPPEGANRHANEQALFYGLTDRWKISGALKFEQPKSDDMRLVGLAAGSLFVLRALDDKKPFDYGLGWYTEVTGAVHRDATNSVLFGLIPTVKTDKLSFTSNLFLEKTFGQNREEGIAFAYGWQVKYDLREGFGLGVEGFGVVDNLGNAPPWSEQEHRIGPVAYTQIDFGRDTKVGVDLGLLFGLTPATPDTAVKLNFNVPIYKPKAGG